MTSIAVGRGRKTHLPHYFGNHFRTRTMPHLHLHRLRKPLNLLRMHREFYSTNDRIDSSHTVATMPSERGLHPGHIHHTDEVLMQTPLYPQETFAEVAICLILKARVYNYYKSLGKARPDKDHSDLSHQERLPFLKLECTIHIVRPYH